MTLDSIFPRPKIGPRRSSVKDAQLADLATIAGAALQDIQDLVDREDLDIARVRFPRGYLRPVSDWRQALAFVRESHVRSNIAHALMMHDVQSWILKRTDLAGHARDMLAKAAMAALGGVAEALLVDATSPPMGKRQPTKPRIDALVADDTVTAEAGTDLYWLWDMRNRQHLAGLDASEFDFYPPDAHPRAEAAVGGLIAALQLRAFAPPG